MRPNEMIKIAGEEYEVLEQCGEGGQGAVWKAKNTTTGEIFAVKILIEKNPNRKRSKLQNINIIINEKLDEKMSGDDVRYGINHVFPIARYSGRDEAGAEEAGYLMEFISGKSFSKIIVDGTVSRMSFEQKLNLLIKVARAVDMLHCRGFCYSDISLGNFMYNEKTDTVAVIDCENISSLSKINDGSCAFLKGTGFFIAPEVAFEDQCTSYATDRYALATLMFRFLTDDGIPSPYHGEAMFKAVPACADMMEVAEYEADDEIDKNWRHFVFDENDHSNGLDNVAKNSTNPENIKLRKKIESTIDLWNNLPGELKVLFHSAFDDPFNRQARPLASTWARTMANILNSMKPASSTGVVREANPQKQNPQGAKNKYKSFNALAVAKPRKAYKPFVPAGGRQEGGPAAVVSFTAVPSAPCLIGAKGKSVAISGAVMHIHGRDLGLAQGEIGTLAKVADGYTFTSKLQTAVEVKSPDGKIKAKLYKGQSTNLRSGDIIKPVISTVSLTIKF